MCNKVDNHCRDEKLTCEGCAYDRKEKYTEIGQLEPGGMLIKTKYRIEEKVWVVYENHGEACVYSDEIQEIYANKDGIGYFLKNCGNEIKEENIISYIDETSLLHKIKEIDSEFYRLGGNK